MAEKSTSGESIPKKTRVINSISLAEAKRWARRWAKKEDHYDKHHDVKAFLIPKADLIEVLTEGVDAVRAYIGVNDDNVEKLMIVGTKYNKETGVYQYLITVAPAGSELAQDDIYDFTRPCPPDCDCTSPLFI